MKRSKKGIQAATEANFSEKAATDRGSGAENEKSIFPRNSATVKGFRPKSFSLLTNKPRINKPKFSHYS